MIEKIEYNKEQIRDYSLIGFSILAIINFFMFSQILEKICLVIGLILIGFYTYMAIKRIQNQELSYPIHKIVMYLSILVFFIPLSDLITYRLSPYIKLGSIILLFLSGFYLKGKIEKTNYSENMMDNYMAPFFFIFFILGFAVKSDLERNNLDRLHGEQGNFYVMASKTKDGKLKKYPAQFYVDNEYTGRSYEEEGSYGQSITHDEEITIIDLIEMKVGSQTLKFNSCNLSQYHVEKCRDNKGQVWYIKATDKKVKQ